MDRPGRAPRVHAERFARRELDRTSRAAPSRFQVEPQEDGRWMIVDTEFDEPVETNHESHAWAEHVAGLHNEEQGE